MHYDVTWSAFEMLRAALERVHDLRLSTHADELRLEGSIVRAGRRFWLELDRWPMRPESSR